MLGRHTRLLALQVRANFAVDPLRRAVESDDNLAVNVEAFVVVVAERRVLHAEADEHERRAQVDGTSGHRAAKECSAAMLERAALHDSWSL